MPTKFQWLYSGGGPFLALPHELLRFWRGVEEDESREIEANFRFAPDSPATDYDRACDVVSSVSLISVGDGQGIVVNAGDVPCAALSRVSDESAVIIERVEGKEDAAQQQLAGLSRKQFPPPELFLDLRRGQLDLLESTNVGDDGCEFQSIKLTPGRYSVATMDGPGEDSQTALHWLQREGPAGKKCKAEQKMKQPRPRRLATARKGEPLFPVQVDGKWGYINRRGKLVIPGMFTTFGHFSEGLLPALRAGKYGFVDTSGEFVIPPIYTHAEAHCDGLARVNVGENYFYINRQGKQPFDCPFALTSSFSDGRACVAVGRKKLRWGYINTQGKVVIECRYDSAPFFFGRYAHVSLRGRDYVIDTNGRILFKMDPGIRVHRFREGLASFSLESAGGERDGVGFLDISGKVVIGPTREWNFVGEFSEGLAAVHLPDGTYRYIDRSGRVVIATEFREAKMFSEGRAAAGMQRGKLGYIDRTGKFVIKPRFSLANEFQNGLAAIKINGKWGYIDRRGTFVWEPTK